MEKLRLTYILGDGTVVDLHRKGLQQKKICIEDGT